ncbi:cation diffusion facilitator family transporter [candidate division WOR-3 bacterium]|nr:cation diffusion facilitator family transporter [candidate division WOR-3 bacterium]
MSHKKDKQPTKFVAILSTLVNVFFVIFKLGIGFLINSAALIADGIHSGLDVFSSLVTFWGIKKAEKPVDEKHPYGYYRFESLAGLVVTILLVVSAVWIFYEGVERILQPEAVVFSFWAIVIVILSILVNEIMARVKFYFGNKYESISLAADAEHSRADSISSMGVLGGLILAKFFFYADAVIAIIIGAYILKEAFNLGKEITDSLLDVANPELENKIKQICDDYKIKFSDLKTRKIGPANFAELKILLDPKLKIDQANSVIKTLENRLLKENPELKHVVIAVESHEMKESIIKPRFGRKFGFRRGFEPVGPKKLGKRTIIPVEKDLSGQHEISEHFGVAEYLIIDRDEKGNILRKEIIKNPYYKKDSGHGFKFTKSVSADKVIASHIGENAKRNLEVYNIETEIVSKGKKLKDLVNF